MLRFSSLAAMFLAPVLLAGCGLFADSSPSGAESAKHVSSGTRSEHYSVSPAARKYFDEASGLCGDPLECREPEKAAALLDKAIAADPLDPSAYVLRARVLSELGYQDDAFDDATKAVRMRPSAEAYAVRGLVCLRRNSPAGAARDFENAERIDASEPAVPLFRAAGAFLEGRTSDGCAGLEKACRLGVCSPLEKSRAGGTCR